MHAMLDVKYYVVKCFVCFTLLLLRVSEKLKNTRRRAPRNEFQRKKRKTKSRQNYRKRITPNSERKIVVTRNGTPTWQYRQHQPPSDTLSDCFVFFCCYFYLLFFSFWNLMRLDDLLRLHACSVYGESSKSNLLSFNLWRFSHCLFLTHPMWSLCDVTTHRHDANGKTSNMLDLLQQAFHFDRFRGDFLWNLFCVQSRIFSLAIILIFIFFIECMCIERVGHACWSIKPLNYHR